MTRNLFVALVVSCLLPACATGKGASAGNADLTIVVAEQNARIGKETFDIRDFDALEAGLAGACADGCKLIEMRSTPTARYDALRTVYQAAVKGKAQTLLMPLQLGSVATLSPLVPQPCRSEVVVRDAGIDVYVDGEILPPGECSDWSATVCSADSEDPHKRYAWTELAERVSKFRPRFEGPVCLYLERKMSASLLEHLMKTVQAEAPAAQFALLKNRPTGKVDHDAVTNQMVANSASLTECYETEISGGATQSMNLTLRFVIIPPGKVGRAGVTDAQGTTPRFEKCLVDAVSNVEFPAPDNGGAYVINFPLTFSPSK